VVFSAILAATLVVGVFGLNALDDVRESGERLFPEFPGGVRVAGESALVLAPELPGLPARPPDLVEVLSEGKLDAWVAGYQRVVSDRFDTALRARQNTAAVVRDVVGVGDVSAWMMGVYRDIGLSTRQREVVSERMKAAVVAGSDVGALERAGRVIIPF
jgi:hypothetical protein